MNWALREVLGDHIQQKGSLVDHEKTRFDFSHPKALTPEQIEHIEQLVNEKIRQNLPVHYKVVPQHDALKINGLRAVFGERYPDEVRVMSVGVPVEDLLAKPDNPEWRKYSIEFCGGTHLHFTGEIEHFAIITEEAVAKGIRRIVGITSDAARRAEATAGALAERLEAIAAGPPGELGDGLTAIQRELVESTISLSARHRLQEKISELQKTARQAEKQQAAASSEAVMDCVASLLSSATTTSGVTVVVGQVPPAGPDALRGAIDWIRNKTQASAVLLATAEEAKVTLIAGMSREVVARGVKAGDLIKEIAPLVGGRGGGRPDMAQGGGTNPQAVPQALDRARIWLDGKLG
jgi:alanyl-tRNA synthetase